MIRLDNSTRKLQIKLSSSVTTNQLPVTVFYNDKTTSDYIGGTQLSLTFNANLVDICNSPVVGNIRDIDAINILNTDTTNAVVTVQYDDNGTVYVLFVNTIAPGDQINYSHGSGWQVLDSTGSLKLAYGNVNYLQGYTWDSPGPIGATTPNSGNFTNVSATNFTGTLLGSADIALTSYGLLSTTTTINVSNSIAPVAGQILIANSSTDATWQNAPPAGVTAFNTRIGSVTLDSLDVTSALGFTPYDAANPSSFINAAGAPLQSFNTRTGSVTLTSLDVTSALGFTPGTGSVTTVSVLGANGFVGTVSNATTTPVISISTSVTGMLKGNGTSMTTAVADVDYSTPVFNSTNYEPKNANIQAHISNTSNPHATTAAQVGAVPILAPITAGTATKVTYNTNGLILSGINATTADIADSLNRRYVTDSELTTLTTLVANTSGVNTGDQNLSGLVPKTTTVNGHALTNNIAVTSTDVGLGNVDNTSDATKNSAIATLTNHTLNTSQNTLTIGQDLDFGGFELKNAKDPTTSQSLATKNYVDNSSSGLLNKTLNGVTVATTTILPAFTYQNGTSGVGATITITATGNLTVDNHVVLLNEYVLVKDEVTTNLPYNGYYLCTTQGATGVSAVLTRTSNMDQGTEFAGSYVFVNTGTINTFTGWNSTVIGTIIVGTTAIPFAQFSSSSGSPVAGTGITVVGNTVSVNNSTVPYKTDNLSVFAATTSAQLAGVVSDETGTGALVFGTSPSISTPHISGLTTHISTGDQIICSNDTSPFRTGSWSTVASGDLYTLVGDFVMQYWSHNVSLDANGNFLGRDDAGDCALWVFTESEMVKTYYAPTGAVGTVPTGWVLVESLDLATGNKIVTGTITGSTLITPHVTDFTNATHDHSSVANGGSIVVKSIVSDVYTGAGAPGTPTGTLQTSLSNRWSHGVDSVQVGIVTANGLTGVDITGGVITLRKTNSSDGLLEPINVAAVTNHDISALLAVGDVYVYVTYDTGAVYLFSNTDPDPTFTNFTIAKIAEIHTNIARTVIDAIHDVRSLVCDAVNRWSNIFRNMLGTITSGQVCSSNSLHLAISAGWFFAPGMNSHQQAAFDTSAADTFIYWYRDGFGGWTTIAGRVIFDVHFYDDGSGTLAAVPTGQYKRDMIYRDLNGTVNVLYGQSLFSNESEARAASVNPVLPSKLQPGDHSFLLSFTITNNASTNTAVFDQASRIIPITNLTGEYALLNRENYYANNGDQDIRSSDSSHYRIGTWATVASGALYTLVGDFVMQYWTHNVALDVNGNFLGREAAGSCTIGVFTEGGLLITYNCPTDVAGSVPINWSIVEKFDTNTGDRHHTGQINYLTYGDQQIISQDTSYFRTGSWATLSSGSMYTLLGDYAMWYWTHNVALDVNGNFLGRDDTGDCSLWVFTESGLVKWYTAPTGAIGTLPVWSLVETFNTVTGDHTFTGTTALAAATATSVNKVAITAPATGATLTIADGATLSAPSSATVSGTNTGNETASSIGTLVAGAANKTTFTASDYVLVTDSTSGNIVNHVSWTNFAAQFVSNTSFGTANQVLGVNATASGLEYKTITAGTGITIGQAAGSITINSTGVSSVGLAVPAALGTVSGSPVTGAGTLTFNLSTQPINTVFAGPVLGSPATPTFRTISLGGNDISDVVVTSPAANQSIYYDAAVSKWVNTYPAVRIVDKTTTNLIIAAIGPTATYSIAVPGGTLGTSNILRLKMAGLWQNTAGANRTVTVSILYGGTTLWQDTSGNLSANSSCGWDMDITLCANNSTTSQTITGIVDIGSKGTTSIGLAGDLATYTSTGRAVFVSNNGTIDSTITTAFQVNVTFSNTGQIWTKYYHTLELL